MKGISPNRIIDAVDENFRDVLSKSFLGFLTLIDCYGTMLDSGAVSNYETYLFYLLTDKEYRGILISRA